MAACGFSAAELSDRAGAPTAGHIRKVMGGDVTQLRVTTLRSLGTALGDPNCLMAYAPTPAPTSVRVEHIAGRWYQHIPSQKRRPYESVDELEMTFKPKSRRDRVTAAIRRVHSTRPGGDDEGQIWEGVGVVCEERSAYLAFANVSPRRADSNGAIAIRRSHGDRTIWHGYYLRFPENDTGEAGGAAPWCRIDWYRDPAAVPVKEEWLREDAQ
jgi:hypothetical protein